VIASHELTFTYLSGDEPEVKVTSRVSGTRYIIRVLVGDDVAVTFDCHDIVQAEAICGALHWGAGLPVVRLATT
jgi:hypothetical protein